MLSLIHISKDYLRSAWVRRVNIPGDDVLALEGLSLIHIYAHRVQPGL